MIRNIKTEIIYHNCPTDFEFEFNLCGSSQMRLLTESCETQKDFIKYLDRGVSRSRIIIIIGDISGQNNVTKLTADAIGYDTQIIENSEYSIKNNNTSTIISGAVPLITSAGVFGGCIIESGPQTIILITKDKDIRKSIMKELIHDYISDLSHYSAETPISNQTHQTDDGSENNDIITTEPLDSESEPEPNSEHNINDNVDNNPQTDTENYKNSPVFDASDPYNINNITANNNIPENKLNLIDKAPKPKKHTAYKISVLIISIILLFIVAFLIYTLVYKPMVNGVSVLENMRETFDFLNIKFK